ncbi:hypothetical protein WMY93_002552 [Mugilogobius chulae]|uniref:FA complementation group B n=1 Tax=Mugilogobius chulae TaxID=88201 RepID=A0AAW0PZZ9_9GOBI
MEELTSQTCFQHHLVSSRGKLISFHKQVPSRTDSDRGNVFFSRRSFKREDNLFLNEANGLAVIARSKGSNVEIIKCKCVLHTQKRLIVPCILVVKNAKKSDGFHYSLLFLSNSNQLEPCFKFNLPYRLTEDVFILEGPTVLWIHAGHVWCTSSQAEVKQLPFQMSHTVIGELPLSKGSFVLGLQNVLESDQDVTSQICGYFIQDGQMFDGNLILPHPYISITCAHLVLTALQVDDALKISSVVATSNQQLLYVVNSVVKDVCQLPFVQPEGIQLVNTGRNGFLFVITFNDNRVCAVWKETFTVASEWSGVNSVLVDDFLGIGTDQILLFFKETNATDLPSDFLITDLCGVSYSSVRTDELMKPPCVHPENYFFTIQALESRLLIGFKVLEELQREEKAKDKVIQQSLLSLTDDCTRTNPVVAPLEQESLVTLWDCDETKEDIENDKMQDLLTMPSNPQVDKLWHRVTGDQLVVGVILTTVNSGPVSGLSLFILTETSQSSMPSAIQTQSQVFWLPALSPPMPCTTPPSASSYASSYASSSCTEPTAKRSRQQHIVETSHDLSTGRLAVTALAALTPLLNSGRVKCHVLLHYAPTGDGFGPASNQTPAILHCGQLVLDLHSNLQLQLVSNLEDNTDKSRENLLSLMGLLGYWKFHIDSPDYSLGDIVDWIQKRVDCKRIDVSPQHLLINSTDHLLLHCSAGIR